MPFILRQDNCVCAWCGALTVSTSPEGEVGGSLELRHLRVASQHIENLSPKGKRRMGVIRRVRRKKRKKIKEIKI